VGQSTGSCERANCIRYRCTCASPAVKLTDKNNKERLETLKRAVTKGSYFYESYCIAYPQGEASYIPSLS
jgi:hypothetical protein